MGLKGEVGSASHDAVEPGRYGPLPRRMLDGMLDGVVLTALGGRLKDIFGVFGALGVNRSILGTNDSSARFVTSVCSACLFFI